MASSSRHHRQRARRQMRTSTRVAARARLPELPFPRQAYRYFDANGNAGPAPTVTDGFFEIRNPLAPPDGGEDYEVFTDLESEPEDVSDGASAVASSAGAVKRLSKGKEKEVVTRNANHGTQSSGRAKKPMVEAECPKGKARYTPFPKIDKQTLAQADKTPTKGSPVAESVEWSPPPTWAAVNNEKGMAVERSGSQVFTVTPALGLARARALRSSGNAGLKPGPQFNTSATTGAVRASYPRISETVAAAKKPINGRQPSYEPRARPNADAGLPVTTPGRVRKPIARDSVLGLALQAFKASSGNKAASK
ncbi:hypothetical protein FN846DRAFT_1022290 [Sphaerosporella brunnea]|uniref:Uncharacterized protein n=1 Tax=Sphaerosporella brunnea TaxID=1250544 RepID=A0A5J5ETK0_9PEZI|nr:hypothetical protein FN846DRAFT_1022289 [Sphaerosporella brunnea]KAA8903350.1 hypothetical protein FN846DRAFT_1022290 [Sphaerosporella brunnea]